MFVEFLAEGFADELGFGFGFGLFLHVKEVGGGKGFEEPNVIAIRGEGDSCKEGRGVLVQTLFSPVEFAQPAPHFVRAVEGVPHYGAQA